MRIISYIIWAICGLALIILAIANRQPVILNLVPEEMSELLPFGSQVSVPLFLVILLGVLLGLLIGFLWEYVRELKYRSNANKSARDVKRLEREVARLRRDAGEDKDEILALLD
ncbi:MAG: lipopolysaccharide assembly protein LapA domain-containing protein [Pseudomonadota bacterium]